MAIRFELEHPGGAPHEVELPGAVAVIGRDPTCDLVLSDSKCSRRHAVVEQGSGGLVIRDAGSANGVFVNGRRRERATLRPGDTVRLGQVTLRVLGETGVAVEDSGETVVLAPLDLDPGPAAAPELPTPKPVPEAPPPPAPMPRAERRPPLDAGVPTRGRPLTLTLLSVLWALLAPVWVGVGILLAARGGLGAPGAVLAASVGLALGLASGVMAVGVAAQAPWARRAQIAAAVVSLPVCPFTFAAATVLLYMLRDDVRTGFEGRTAPAGAGAAEATYALSIAGMLALGILITAATVDALTQP